MIVGVTGGKGGPGATVLAVRLASGLARRGHDVLLADLDPAGGDAVAYLDSAGALDPRRGLLPLLKLERGPIGDDALARELQPLSPSLKILLGLLRPAPDLLAGRADGLLRTASRLAEIVVADVGRRGRDRPRLRLWARPTASCLPHEPISREPLRRNALLVPWAKGAASPSWQRESEGCTAPTSWSCPRRLPETSPWRCRTASRPPRVVAACSAVSIGSSITLRSSP